MKKHVTFRIEDISSFGILTDNYFLAMGFTKERGTQNSLVYAKGSGLMNLVTFNPLNWKTVVTVTVMAT